jgi:DNA-binding FadR family transcriptional regulator
MTSILLKPVERASVTEVVAESILSLIRDGHLKPGDRLPSQKQLVQMLKVSLPTLREALTGLTMLGYIEVQPGQGYFVREMRSDEILDFSVVSALVNDETITLLYEARAVIETALTQVAAARAEPEDIARMRSCIERMEEAAITGDPYAITGGLDFHQLIADATHNVFLSQIESTLLGFFREYLPRIPLYTRSKDAEPHLRILERIEAGDTEGAAKLAYEHIRDFAKRIGIEISRPPILGPR